MATFFISYAREDLAAAREIHSELAGVGMACWRDENWLAPGDDFAEKITSAIRACDAFVLLLSLSSNVSDYVSREVAVAHHFRKPIIPVLLDSIEPGDGILPYIVRLHYRDFRTLGASGLVTDLAARFVPVQEQHAEAARSSLFVTGAEYARFLRVAKKRIPSGIFDGADPVTRVSWDEAIAYCDWAGGALPANGDHRPPEGADLRGLTEWWDAGTERHKEVRDPRTAGLVAVMDRNARAATVGFRCVPPRPPVPRRWVRIAGGTHAVGVDAAPFRRVAELHRLPRAQIHQVLNRTPGRVRAKPFSISMTAVTNEELYEFTRATGRPWLPYWNARWMKLADRPFPARLAARPATDITAEQAAAFCIWARARLPTWIEWERAAGGPERRPYPWGVEYDPSRCNSIESERGSLAAVDEYAAGDTAEGVRQMCGNVAEWVVGPDGVVESRGGSYRTPCELWGLAYAFRAAEAGLHASDIGFRIVAD